MRGLEPVGASPGIDEYGSTVHSPRADGTVRGQEPLQVASIDAPTDDKLFGLCRARANGAAASRSTHNGGDAPLQVASVVPLPPGA